MFSKFKNLHPIKGALLKQNGEITTFDDVVISPPDEKMAERYKNMHPIVDKKLLEDGSIVNLLYGLTDTPVVASKYVNVSSVATIPIAITKTEVLRIPSTSLTNDYDYRFYANCKVSRTGGGENTRTTVTLSIEQGANTIIVGDISIFRDSQIWLNIPQIAKRYALNNTQDVVFYVKSNDTVATISVITPSLTIE